MARFQTIPVLSLFFVLFFFNTNLFSQCSDAGVCSVGGHTDGTHSNSISLTYVLGGSGKPESVTFHTVNLSGGFSLGGGYQVDLNIPFSTQAGESFSTSGLGDLSLIASKQHEVSKNISFLFSLGFKLPTGAVHLKNDAPQIYQSGLGTYDILAGAGFIYRQFDFLIGFQIPFGRSENKDTRLQRAPDLMIRGGYSYLFGESAVKVELIGIKRLGLSSRLYIPNPWVSTIAGTESFVDVDGSDQTQLNIGLGFNTKISNRVKVDVYGAMPLLKRDNNIDGLKRAFTLSVGVGYLF